MSGSVTSRRGLLVMAAATAGGFAAVRRAVAGPEGGRKPVLLNDANRATDTTSIEGRIGGAVLAVSNRTPRGWALSGHVGPGPVTVTRREETAIVGFNNNERVKYPPVGVTGVAQGKDGVGVLGVGRRGIGVQGQGKVAVQGIGEIAGEFAGAVALRLRGRIETTQAGIAVIPEGKTSHDVTATTVLSPGSAVLATAQGDGKVQVAGARRIDASTFRVHLTQAAPAGGLEVAYLVLQ